MVRVRACDVEDGACPTPFAFGVNDKLEQFNGRPPSVAEVTAALDDYYAAS